MLLTSTLLRAELVQIHVNHSVAARDLLTRCDQAARSDPGQAVALLGQLLERHADELIEAEAGLYVSAGLAARRQVAQWPARSLQKVQKDGEALAAEQWQGIADSPDFFEIQRFARRWFFTPVGGQAAERAARLALEAGHVDLARLEAEDLLAYHPQREQLADRWRPLLAANLPVRQHEPGDLDEKANLAVLWKANLTVSAQSQLEARPMPPHWLPLPVGLPDLGIVLIQWDGHCFAFDPGSGARIWHFCPLSERMAVRAGIAGPTAPRRPAVWRKRVYVVCDAPLAQDKMGPAEAVQALACLDAQTGRAYWVRGMAERMSRQAPTILDGTPVVADGFVYVAARVARTAVYDEIFLLKVDARTGDLLGRTHLFGLGRVEQTPFERIRPMRLGWRGGILYVASPAGAAGAVDAESLQPIWVRLFEPQADDGAQDAEMPEVRESDVPALWADEPLVVDDNLVVPVEASLHVLDRLSGRSIRTIVMDGPVQALSARPGAPHQVAAVAGRNLYVVDTVAGTIARKISLGMNAGAIGGLCPLSGGRLLVCAEDLLLVAGPDDSVRELPVELVPPGIPAIVQGRLYLGANGCAVCVADAPQALAHPGRQTIPSNGPPPAAADEAAGNMQAAATRMARLASQLEDAAFQLATGMRTAKRHAARPTAKPPRRVRPPCHIEPPLQPAHSQMLEDSVWLLTGVTGGGADQKRRVLVWSAGTLRAFDPQTLQPAWQPSLIFKSQPALLADDGCLIVHDRCRVTALQPGDGQVLWTWAGKGPDPQAPSVDPEAVPVILAAAAAADSILVATAGGRLACIDRHSGRLRWQRPGDPAFVGDLAVSEELAAYRGSQADRIVYRVFEAATGQDVSLLKPARDSPAESVEILSSEMVLLQGTNAIEAYDAYGGTLAWQVPARGRFRPAIRLHKGTAFYIGDGDRQLTKIDTRTGQATWWAVAPADTGSPVCLLDGDSVIWLIGERGAHVIDHATGKVVGTAALPPEVDPGVVIRYAAVCHAGVLCLAVKRSGCDPDVPPAVLALLPWHPTSSDTSRRRNAGSLDTGPLRRGSATQAPETHRADTTAALLARIDEATGPINGWDITDNAVWIAAGDRLITLRGQAKADP